MTYHRESAIKKPKYLVTSHTTSQVTNNEGNSFITIAGSEISYTPSTGSSKVIYEIAFYAEKIDGLAFQCLQLEEYDGSNWSEINAKYRKNFGVVDGSSSQENRWYLHFRFVLPAWNGEKQLRLRSSDSTSGRQIYYHQLTHWDGASATDQFCNTNLLMYSI